MAAQVDIVLNAIDKTQGALRSAGQSLKSLGATVGIAAGMFYAANAALDGMESRLRALDMGDVANSIGDAQDQWQALADTILVGVANSDVFVGIMEGLKSAGIAAQQLFVLMQIIGAEARGQLGITSRAEAEQDKINAAKQYQATLEKSLAASAKDRNKDAQKQNDELQKQIEKYDAINSRLDDAINKRDPKAIRAAQADLGKFSAENPNLINNKGGGVSVSIIGGGMKDVVTQIIIDGVSIPFARDTDKGT